MGIFATALLPWMMTAHYNHLPPVQQQKREVEQRSNQIRLNLTDFWTKMNKKLVQKVLTDTNLIQGEHYLYNFVVIQYIFSIYILFKKSLSNSRNIIKYSLIIFKICMMKKVCQYEIVFIENMFTLDYNL